MGRMAAWAGEWLSVCMRTGRAIFGQSRELGWRWKPGPPKFYPLPMAVRPLEGFTEDDGGKLLIGIEGGLRRFFDGKIEAFPLPGTMQPFLTRRLLRDHDGGLWIAAYNAGLVHIHDGRADVFRQADGLSDDDVIAL